MQNKNPDDQVHQGKTTPKSWYSQKLVKMVTFCLEVSQKGPSKKVRYTETGIHEKLKRLFGKIRQL